MDIVARLVLGTGILLSGAALITWFVTRKPQMPAPNTTADRPSSDTRSTVAPPPDPAKPPARSASTDETMSAFFAALPPRTPEAPMTLDRYAGTWTAKIVSVDVEGDQAPIRDAGGLPDFKFTIAPASGGWQMAAADGRGNPRTLVAGSGEVVARGDGAPDVHLSLRGSRLVGFVATQRPAKGSIEFHATKDP